MRARRCRRRRIRPPARGAGPSRSAVRPSSIKKPPNTSANALTTHGQGWLFDNPRSLPIDGSATATSSRPARRRIAPRTAASRLERLTVLRVTIPVSDTRDAGQPNTVCVGLARRGARRRLREHHPPLRRRAARAAGIIPERRPRVSVGPRERGRGPDSSSPAVRLGEIRTFRDDVKALLRAAVVGEPPRRRRSNASTPACQRRRRGRSCATARPCLHPRRGPAARRAARARRALGDRDRSPCAAGSASATLRAAGSSSSAGGSRSCGARRPAARARGSRAMRTGARLDPHADRGVHERRRRGLAASLQRMYSPSRAPAGLARRDVPRSCRMGRAGHGGPRGG